MKKLILFSLGLSLGFLFNAPANAFKDGVRALNSARMKAENINGGLGVYRAEKCMYLTSEKGGKCLINQEEGFTYIFMGGEPGWQENGVEPTIETEIQVSPDGQSEIEVIYNGDGYMFNDVAHISSEMNPEKNSDGTYTLRYGCDSQPSNIPIREGNKTGKFNVLVRHYGPSKMVSNDEEGYNPTKNIKEAK
jgi:hypothetical protein